MAWAENRSLFPPPLSKAFPKAPPPQRSRPRLRAPPPPGAFTEQAPPLHSGAASRRVSAPGQGGPLSKAADAAVRPCAPPATCAPAAGARLANLPAEEWEPGLGSGAGRWRGRGRCEPGARPRGFSDLLVVSFQHAAVGCLGVRASGIRDSRGRNAEVAGGLCGPGPEDMGTT